MVSVARLGILVLSISWLRGMAPLARKPYQDTRLRSSIKEVVCHLDISVLGRVYKPPPPHDFHWRKIYLYLSLPRLFKVIR